MMPSERRSLALEYIQQRGLCGIGDLAGLLDVSRVTVHRILDELEGQGLVRKERGGVRIVETSKPEGRFEQRIAQHLELKRELARKAVKFVEDGDTLFIDASTTCYCFAEALGQLKPNAMLTIVTNSPFVLQRFIELPDYHVTSTGGELDHRLNALVGSITLDTIGKLQFNKAFISPHCVSPLGIMTPHSSTFEVYDKVIGSAAETTLLAESPKFGQMSPLLIAPLSALKRIVTDSKLSKEMRQLYSEDAAVPVI